MNFIKLYLIRDREANMEKIKLISTKVELLNKTRKKDYTKKFKPKYNIKKYEGEGNG